MDRTPSPREECLARHVRLLLRGLRVGDDVAIPEGFYRDVPNLCKTMTALEYFIPEVICEIESCATLDGVFPYKASKVAPLQMTLVGACVYIQGGYAPLYVQLRAARHNDVVEWFYCRLGELGRHGEKLYGNETGHNTLGLKTLHRLDQIRWKHCVEYGERGPATKVP